MKPYNLRSIMIPFAFAASCILLNSTALASPVSFTELSNTDANQCISELSDAAASPGGAVVVYEYDGCLIAAALKQKLVDPLVNARGAQLYYFVGAVEHSAKSTIAKSAVHSASDDPCSDWSGDEYTYCEVAKQCLKMKNPTPSTGSPTTMYYKSSNTPLGEPLIGDPPAAQITQWLLNP